MSFAQLEPQPATCAEAGDFPQTLLEKSPRTCCFLLLLFYSLLIPLLAGPRQLFRFYSPFFLLPTLGFRLFSFGLAEFRGWSQKVQFSVSGDRTSRTVIYPTFNGSKSCRRSPNIQIMSLLSGEPEDGSDANPYVHSAGPAILLPAEAIGNIVSRANDLISDHREWLANLPLQKEEAKRQIFAVPQPSFSTPISSLNGQIVGPSPLPSPEAIGIFPPANSLLSSLSSGVVTSSPSPSQVTASQAQASAVASASIASLQSALSSANIALASARLSASIALATASASLQSALNNAFVQSQSALAATQSASLAIASAQTSASQAVAAAQSTASASVLSANNALSSVEASASNAVQRASLLASGAQGMFSQLY